MSMCWRLQATGGGGGKQSGRILIAGGGVGRRFRCRQRGEGERLSWEEGRASLWVVAVGCEIQSGIPSGGPSRFQIVGGFFAHSDRQAGRASLPAGSTSSPATIHEVKQPAGL